MGRMTRAVRSRPTVPSGPPGRRRPPIRAAYEHYRLDREGALVSQTTLRFYDANVLPFLSWLDGEGVQRFEHLKVNHARRYRARLASRPGRHGRQLQPDTLHGSHRAVRTFLRWASREGCPVDSRILGLAPPRVPAKEPTVYHIAQVRAVLAACNPAVPTEDLMVRLLVGSGIRRAEVRGLWARMAIMPPRCSCVSSTPGVVDEPVPGGLSVEDAETIVRATTRHFRIRAATLATYAPDRDRDGRTVRVVLRLIELLGDYAGRNSW